MIVDDTKYNKKSVNIAVGARYSPSFSNTLIDYEPHCATWAAIGECNSNHDYMFDNCAYSCVSAEDLGEVGYFYEHLSDGEDFEKNEECTDEHKLQDGFTCEEFAISGECHLNQKFMMEECSKSCLKCFPGGYVMNFF